MVDSEEIAGYEAHFALLKQWNEKMNLVSSRSLETAFATHYADSIWISELARGWSESRPMFDIGTGAGFPGLIFSIRFPEAGIYAYEKSPKKQTFLKAVSERIPRLKKVRLDGFLPDRRQFGFFMSRAVFSRERFFTFYESKLETGSRVLACLGSKSEGFSGPENFKKIAEHEYVLPLDQGARRCELFEYVSRGTKPKL